MLYIIDSERSEEHRSYEDVFFIFLKQHLGR